MRNNTVEVLVDKLSRLRYKSSSSYSGEFPIINPEHMPLVRQVISETVLDQYDSELGQLQAKVTIYEELISKSNFSVVIDEKQEEDDYLILEMLKDIQMQTQLIEEMQSKLLDFSYETKVDVKTLLEDKE